MIARAQARINRYQFIDPMSTSMAAEHRFTAVCCQARRQFRIAKHRTQMAFHLRPIACHQKIFARSEQPLAVLPWRADQRDTASKRFEWANGRNPRQSLGIGLSLHVHRDPETAEEFGHPEIREPTTVFD